MRRVCAVTLILLTFTLAQTQTLLPVPNEPRAMPPPLVQTNKLETQDARGFGYSIDVNGDTPGSILVVGAPVTVINGTYLAGAVYVYELGMDREWVFRQRLVAPIVGASQFGASVAVSGSGADTIIAVGAPYENYNGAEAGRVYVFGLEGAEWVIKAALATTIPAQGIITGRFGWSIDLTGSGDEMLLAVGGPAIRTGWTSASGSVHLYQQSAGSWEFVTLIQPPDGGLGLGLQVALHGTGNDMLLVAASTKDAVYLYNRLTGVWQHEQNLMYSADIDWIYSNLAVAGPPGQRIIVLSAPADPEGGIFVYTHNGSAWALMHHIIPVPPFYELAGAGWATAVTGSALGATIFASNPEYDSQDELGRVYRIEVTPDEYQITQVLYEADPQMDSSIGRALAVPPDGDGSLLFVGRPFYSTGALYTFELTPAVHVTPEAFTVIEGTPGASYSMVLATQPSEDVTVTAHSQTSCYFEVSTTTTRTFTPENWMTPQIVTVRAPLDFVPEIVTACQISHSVASADPDYSGIPVQTVVANIVDARDEWVSLSGHTSLNLKEGDSADAYTIELLQEPSASVLVYIVPDANCDVGTGPGQLRVIEITADAWYVPAIVPVSAVDDHLNEGTHHCVITNSLYGAPEYQVRPVLSVTAVITDNDLVFLLVNGDFENGKRGPWRLQNASRDTVKCRTRRDVIYPVGNCDFVFRGSATEASSLTQTIDGSVLEFGYNDALRLQLSMQADATVKGKVKLLVTYADGGTSSIQMPLMPHTSYMAYESEWLLLQSTEVVSIKVTIKHRSKSGKARIDAVRLWVRPVKVTRETIPGFRQP